MDLSKAFDCLRNGILIAKLRAYGRSKEAVGLLESYLSDRSQQVGLGQCTSPWEPFQGGPSKLNIMIRYMSESSQTISCFKKG